MELGAVLTRQKPRLGPILCTSSSVGPKVIVFFPSPRLSLALGQTVPVSLMKGKGLIPGTETASVSCHGAEAFSRGTTVSSDHACSPGSVCLSVFLSFSPPQTPGILGHAIWFISLFWCQAHWCLDTSLLPASRI